MAADRRLYTFGQNIELLKQFNAHGIRYLLVGGLAVNWYCPSRQANDMDLLIAPEPVNAEKLECLLKPWGAVSSRMDGPGLQLVLKTIHNADLLTPPAAWPDYAEISADFEKCPVGSVAVSVASVRSLIRLKEVACAAQPEHFEKHESDIKKLNAILLGVHQIE